MELSITDNGAGSTSVVSEENNSQTTVTSNNNADISNNVSSNANSGNNTVNGADGNSSVTTGDASSTTTANNSANTTSVDSSCQCKEINTGTTAISGNGEGSTNTASNTSTQATNIYSTQNAVIANNIKGTASSGGNKIKDAGGAATIKTGETKVIVTIQNASNNAYISGGNSLVTSSTLIIQNNGIFSVNNLFLNSNNENKVSVTNSSSVFNNVSIGANSGDNYISSSGPARIVTGNSSTYVSIRNTVNSTKVISSCGCNKKEDDPGIPSSGGTISSSPTNTGSGGGTGGDKGGLSEVLGASYVLPATGMSISMWATMFNVLMLLIGLYLRKKAGRSPSTK